MQFAIDGTLHSMFMRSFTMLSFFLLANLTLSVADSGPSKKPLSPTISIEPAAQKTLDRAAKLYGSTARWSGQIVESGGYARETSRISVAYVRPDFIRIDNRQGKDSVFEMADGKRVSSYIQSPDLGSHSTRKIQLRTLSEILGASIASPQATGQYLAALLLKKNVLPTSATQFKSQNLRLLRVKSLAAAAWKGQSCDRVLVEKYYKVEIKKGEETFDQPEWRRDELWFTREGKLAKIVATEKEVNGGSITWKGEISTQNFAPQFGPNIFQFTPPKEKMPTM